jgi:hypothetical protein
MSVEIQLFEFGAYSHYSFRFLTVGMDEKRSLQRKSKQRDELVARIMNSAALLKQELQNDLRRAHLLLSGELESVLKLMVGFLNTCFELLKFIEIIYITNKCNQ